MANIHSSAIVSPQAELADDVVVDAYSIIEADVRIGQYWRNLRGFCPKTAIIDG